MSATSSQLDGSPSSDWNFGTAYLLNGVRADSEQGTEGPGKHAGKEAQEAEALLVCLRTNRSFGLALHHYAESITLKA